jgi:hypothetical protein
MPVHAKQSLPCQLAAYKLSSRLLLLLLLLL